MNAFLELGEKQIAAPRKAQMRAVEKRATRNAAQKALAERDDLHRIYTRWRQERREALFSGPHGATARELDTFLQSMTLDDADALVRFMRTGDWQRAAADTRFEVLSLVNEAITRLRKRNGLVEIDDPLPDQPSTAFIIIRELFR